MNYIGISDFDTANGPGVRVSLFVSGCRLHCRGCFNPESWDFEAGKHYDETVKARLLKALEEEYVEGLSLLGGDPLEPENVDELTELCQAVREKFGNKNPSGFGRAEPTKKSRICRYFSTLTRWSTAPLWKSTKLKNPESGSAAPISA